MQNLSQNADFIRRVNELKLGKRLTWQQVAAAIGMSRAMLHFIKTGKYAVSDRAWRKLHDAEKAAGISPGVIFDAKKLIETITTELDRAKVGITSEDVAGGRVTVPVQYLARRTNDPLTVTLTRPPSTSAAKLVVTVLAEQDFLPILKACLPAPFATDKFLNRLTPFCIHALEEAAAVLTFGLEWRKLARLSGQ